MRRAPVHFMSFVYLMSDKTLLAMAADIERLLAELASDGIAPSSGSKRALEEIKAEQHRRRVRATMDAKRNRQTGASQ